MKKFGELKKVESKPNFNLESKMSRSDAVVRQRNKGKYTSKAVIKKRLEIGFPTLSILKVYNGSFSFDCDLCRGQFYVKTKDFKGCPDCKTNYLYLVYLKKYDCYKVGITYNIYKRLKSLGGGQLLFYRSGGRMEVYNIEQKWLSNLKDYLVVVEGLKQNGGTETFKYSTDD